MFLRALDVFYDDRIKNIRSGQIFETHDSHAKELIRAGLAVEMPMRRVLTEGSKMQEPPQNKMQEPPQNKEEGGATSPAPLSRSSIPSGQAQPSSASRRGRPRKTSATSNPEENAAANISPSTKVGG